MDPEQVRLALEGLDVPSDKIDEFLRFVSLSDDEQNKIAEESGLTVADLEMELINPELDWRRKATIAAKIISRNLE